MELIWKLEAQEIFRLQEFVAAQSTHSFVRYRIKRNVETLPAAVTVDRFWAVLVGCILSSQQRSGPGSATTRLVSMQPFPLSYAAYAEMADAEADAKQILQKSGGIRFTTRIPQQLAANYRALQTDLWDGTAQALESVRGDLSPASERKAAEFLALHLTGVGPKQARNLLQSLGISKYEIPIDSRIVKWLNSFGFPITLSAFALSDSHYYNFVSDGVQAMCQQSGLFPCVLDAAIFSSYDPDTWTDETMVW